MTPKDFFGLKQKKYRFMVIMNSPNRCVFGRNTVDLSNPQNFMKFEKIINIKEG